MTFGKPKRTDEELECLSCGETFKEYEANLKHAGRTVDGDFWNTECPNCGCYDRME